MPVFFRHLTLRGAINFLPCRLPLLSFTNLRRRLKRWGAATHAVVPALLTMVMHDRCICTVPRRFQLRAAPGSICTISLLTPYLCFHAIPQVSEKAPPTHGLGIQRWCSVLRRHLLLRWASRLPWHSLACKARTLISFSPQAMYSRHSACSLNRLAMCPRRRPSVKRVAPDFSFQSVAQTIRSTKLEPPWPFPTSRDFCGSSWAWASSRTFSCPVLRPLRRKPTK